MAIVEASSCGLQVVSTKVGGIPEVLPSDLIYLTEPTVPALMDGLEKAITDLKSGNIVCPYLCNARVRKLYNWVDVTFRTNAVYNLVATESTQTVGGQLQSYLSSGVWPFLLVVSLCYLFLSYLDYMVPRGFIDIAKDYKVDKNVGVVSETGKGSKKHRKSSSVY